jgi:hypothetical protein
LTKDWSAVASLSSWKSFTKSSASKTQTSCHATRSGYAVFSTALLLALLTYNFKTKVTNVNRTRREYEEMILNDDVQVVASRLAALVHRFSQRKGAQDALKEAKLR